MTLRKINRKPYTPSLGYVIVGKKKGAIENALIFSGPSTPVGWTIETDLFTCGAELSPGMALELVKGFLQNLPDVFLAADDELQAILTQKIAAAKADANAVVECLNRPFASDWEKGVNDAAAE